MGRGCRVIGIGQLSVVPLGLGIDALNIGIGWILMTGTVPLVLSVLVLHYRVGMVIRSGWVGLSGAT